MTLYTLEGRCKEWLPGNFVRMGQKMATFAGNLANRLPTGWHFVDAITKSPNMLIIHVEGPDTTTEDLQTEALPILAIAIIAVAALFGVFLVSWVITKTYENIQMEKIKSAEEMLQKGYIDQDMYGKILQSTDPIGTSIGDTFKIIAYGLLIIGGGFLLINSMKK
jgi:hypothetical protein